MAIFPESKHYSLGKNRHKWTNSTVLHSPWLAESKEMEEPWDVVPTKFTGHHKKLLFSSSGSYLVYNIVCERSVALAHQAPLFMEFSKQEHWSGLPFPTPGDLPSPGVKSASPASLAVVGGFFTTGPPGKPHSNTGVSQKVH